MRQHPERHGVKEECEPIVIGHPEPDRRTEFGRERKLIFERRR